MFCSCWSDMERVRMKSYAIVGEMNPSCFVFSVVVPVCSPWLVCDGDVKEDANTMVNAPFCLQRQTATSVLWPESVNRWIKKIKRHWYLASRHFVQFPILIPPKKIKNSSNLSDILGDVTKLLAFVGRSTFGKLPRDHHYGSFLRYLFVTTALIYHAVLSPQQQQAQPTNKQRQRQRQMSIIV